MFLEIIFPCFICIFTNCNDTKKSNWMTFTTSFNTALITIFSFKKKKKTKTKETILSKNIFSQNMPEEGAKYIHLKFLKL